MKTYWFKRKRFGWGWTPATWQGWTVVLVFIVLLTANMVRKYEVINEDAFYLHYLLPETGILILILIAICFLTGESPKWQWGEKQQVKKK